MNKTYSAKTKKPIIFPVVFGGEKSLTFGMGLPGRQKMAENGYRFGFNGKENDDEINGWQDYGMRMYNRLIGRFPTPDPIAKEYPELTTYQFASNSPIENIDVGGLEKYSIHLKNVNGKEQIFKIETDYSLKYIGISAIDGQIPIKPRVVQYITHDKDGKISKVTSEIPLKNIGNTIYVGPWNPKYENGLNKGKDRYDYPPLNSLDEAAYRHDKSYDEDKASGPLDAISSLKTIEADKTLVKDALNVVGLYLSGKNDPVNDQPVSYETANSALYVAKAFTAIVAEKSVRAGIKNVGETFKEAVNTTIQGLEQQMSNTISNSIGF